MMFKTCVFLELQKKGSPDWFKHEIENMKIASGRRVEDHEKGILLWDQDLDQYSGHNVYRYLY